MPPKASNQKRKRGRPPGASRAEQDASNSEIPVVNDEPDTEEQARPRKRGRKPNAEKVDTAAKSAIQDGPAQPSRRGRPPKTSQQDATNDTDPLPGRQRNDTGRKAIAGVRNTMAASKGKGKAAQSQDAQAEEETPGSEPRRSGRERRSWNSDEVFGSDRAASSERRIPYRGPKRAPPIATGTTEDKAKASKSKGKGKAGESNESRAEDEPSGSGPRRSARERQARNAPKTHSGGRQSDEREDQSASVAEKARKKRRAQPSPAEESAPSKSQKQGRGAAKGKTGAKRGRPTSSKEDNGEVRALQPQQGNRTQAPGKTSKQAQHSLVAGSEGESSQPKRRGRPKASDKPPKASEQDQPSEDDPPVRGRPPKSHEDQEEAPPKAKRKQAQPRQLEPVPEEAESSEPEESELPFRHLRVATRNIPRSTITDKWNTLDGPSINAVGAFLADAQRPVLHRLQDTNRRREHASSALSMISRRLRSKLVKGFPFPAPTAGAPTRAGSGSYEDEFDFERTVDAIQALESTLNPLQHSVALLEREIKREEDALARDYDSLHRLEANAKSEAKKWREQARREHVLAPGIKRKSEGDDGEESKESLRLVPKSEGDASGGLFEGLDDEELVTISKQIGSHMESMKGNLQQIDGVVPAIVKSKAALQQVLLKHLDDEQYERVLVG